MSHHCHQPQVSFEHAPSASAGIRSMHDIFADPYRRAVLYYLQHADEPVALGELANTVLAWSPDGDADVRTDGARPETWLRDTHILAMDEFGVLAYDHEEDLVRLPADVSMQISRPWQATPMTIDRDG